MGAPEPSSRARLDSFSVVPVGGDIFLQLEGVAGDDSEQTARGNCRRDGDIEPSDATSREKLTWGRVHEREFSRSASESSDSR